MYGLFFGKFAPLTTGHIAAITKAATMVSQLFVILCWDQKFQDELSDDLSGRMTLRNRLWWLRDSFKHIDNIHVSFVDESQIQSYPDGSEAFTGLVRDELLYNFGVSHIDKVFSSEVIYEDYFSTHWSDSEHVLIDPEREFVHISATMVRSNPYYYWDYLAPAAKKHFVKKVCIIGVESTGKSTLTINLANHFSTQSVEEVGRTICEAEYHFSEDMMNIEDYEYVAMQHKVKERNAAKTANKVLFSDTNNLITLFSAQCMLKHSEMLYDMAKAEKYDLIIMLDTDVPWVYDPLRLNDTDEKRQSTFEHLKSLCKSTGQEYILVSGTYDERFHKSVNLVKNLLKG
jgi:HTH-type transcriptional repressor of NAD biosynthesis genes